MTNSSKKTGMGTGRLEAFSDGVLAVIITIMVLEMKVPHGDDVNSLKLIWPVFLSYVLSFINIGIYWNNHHHSPQWRGDGIKRPLGADYDELNAS